MRRQAFTLIELLVVIGIIAILIGVLVPALMQSRNSARVVVCEQNLRQLGVAVHVYANDFNGHIPMGPDQPVPIYYFQPRMPTTQLQAVVPTTGPTFVGQGKVLDGYINDPRALFCPADNDENDVDEELSKARKNFDMFGSYYYRHGAEQEDSRIDSLGRNSSGERATALALDRNYLPTAFRRTNHDAKVVNILYHDSRVESHRQEDDRFIVPDPSLIGVLAELDRIFREADTPVK